MHKLCVCSSEVWELRWQSAANNLNSTCIQDVYHWWISGLEGLNHVSIG